MGRTVLLVYGGPSGEHEVSRMSALGVGDALRRAGHEVVEAEVGRDGRWLSGGERLSPFGPAPSVDVVFPLIHGPFGEDGALQGVLDWARVPYVGSGVGASAVSIDKAFTKTVLEAAGLPGARWCLVRREELKDGREVLDRCESLGDYPLFVKPARLGSSVGVARATSAAELVNALAQAARHDDRLVVEEAIAGRELECGVLGGVRPRASAVGEIRYPGAFYDYEAKYAGRSGTELDVPARLDEGVAAQVKALATLAFEAVDARDLARVDFFLSRDGRLLVNEINTLPGFTPYSMYPRLWEAAGLAYESLVDELVEMAVRRGPRPLPRAGGGP